MDLALIVGGRQGLAIQDGADSGAADQSKQPAEHAVGALVQVAAQSGPGARPVAVQPQAVFQGGDQRGPLLVLAERGQPDPQGWRALFGVAVTSASNAWAVGRAGHCYGPMATTTTLIVRWNGTAWRPAASPNPAPNSVLTAVAAISASNAWAAGAGENGSILQHWKGTTWK